MSVLIRIDKHKAILRGAEWRCAHQPLEEQLNRFTREWVHREATAEDLNGDLELLIANRMAERFSGRISIHLSRTRIPAARAYFNLRQLSLFDDQ